MSTRYNTGNPIESADVRDMSDNAKNFDEFSNSVDLTFTDRFGVERLTIDGFIKQYGINPASFDFQSGGTLNVGDNNRGVLWPTQSGGDGNYYIWKGTYPKTVPSASSPSSNGGVSNSGWLPIGDITLRSDLSIGSGQLLVGTYESVNEMILSTNASGSVVRCKRYYHGGESVYGLEFISRGVGWPEVADGYTTHCDAGGNFLELIGDRVSAKTSGMVGDNSTDDSLAFNAAISRSKTLGVAVYFETGKYKVPSATSMSGKVFLIGEPGARIIGNLVYQDLTFPPVADITTPLTNQAPFFSCDGLDFESINGGYALSVKAQIQTKFIDTAAISNGRFYGAHGLYLENLVTVTLSDLWFYNSLVGAMSSGCTNIDVTGCRWRNQAVVGFDIVAQAGSFRDGGENIRFSRCEFDVCAIGLRSNRHKWLSIESCLFDYCQLPIFLIGSIYAKLEKTYLGAANVSGSLSKITGYQAPPTTGVALYARPYVNSTSVTPCGFSASNCEFVNYVAGSTLPIVLADGDVPEVPSAAPIERISMYQCKVLTAESHSIAYLVSISKAQIVNLDGTTFVSPNKSTTLIAPYSISNATSWSAINSNARQCTQGGAIVKPVDERTIIGDEHTWVSQSGDVCMRVLDSGSDRMQIFVGGAFKSVGVGGANSAGAGFRQLIVSN